MNTAVQTGNHFQLDCASLVMSFEPECNDEQPAYQAATGYPEFNAPRPRARHLKVAGTHIDVAFGQIDILWKLDKKTLERMATNPSTPVVVLERLAVHPMADVRAAVSDNENTPLYTIWALSKDADADVRYQLAENHNLPLALIRSMTNDENPYVACRAQQTYDRLQAR
jgi:hypothetical protein